MAIQFTTEIIKSSIEPLEFEVRRSDAWTNPAVIVWRAGEYDPDFDDPDANGWGHAPIGEMNTAFGVDLAVLPTMAASDIRLTSGWTAAVAAGLIGDDSTEDDS